MNITKDDFEVWKDHPVTKQFMAEMLEDLEMLRDSRIVGDTDQMIRQAHTRNAQMDLINAITSWVPAPLLTNEESQQ